MAISREQAKELAMAYVASLDLRGYQYEFVGISIDEKWPNEWGAVFDVYTPSGNLMDGPVIFVVEKNSGQVVTLVQEMMVWFHKNSPLRSV
ncbi:hypothetical protein [Undibacterium luofuense]|uniref:Uncharacterized protein n=1 Tax=Undibacterium luofuense TaxID=2828733 RepID=A0A941DU41_9BURK|nr:hypothetical protein [Undibacterium luofuense]MBR7784081.1 hypothetical protein [Undibacterium luofuense]